MFTVFSAKRWIFSLFVCCLASAFLGCAEKPDATITICGSTTAYPIIKMAAERYMQKKNIMIKIHCDGSKDGLKALTNGTSDIAVSSSKVSIGIVSDAESNGLRLQEFVFAHDMIVPIIHPTNPVENLSLDQLNAIFSGSIERWDEVGGKGNKILVVGRDNSSGTGEVWDKIVIKTGTIREDHVTLHTNSDVLAYVAKHPDAVGYISFAYSNPEIKIISVNGVEPTIENARDKTYPILRNVYLYVNEKSFSYEMKSFIIYLLCNEGQEIVEENGLIPLNLLEDINQTFHRQGPAGKQPIRMPGD